MFYQPADDETDEGEHQIKQSCWGGCFPEEDINRYRLRVLDDQNKEDDPSDRRGDELVTRIDRFLGLWRELWCVGEGCVIHDLAPSLIESAISRPTAHMGRRVPTIPKRNAGKPKIPEKN